MASVFVYLPCAPWSALRDAPSISVVGKAEDDTNPPRRVSLVVTVADKGSGQEPALPLDTSWPSRRRLVFQNHVSFTGLSGSLRSFRCTLIDVEESPVSCALMSGLLRGTCRWPSWVCACVSGTNLFDVLEAHCC